MSRTKRDIRYAKFNHRRISWKAHTLNLQDWVDEMVEEGFGEFVKNRDQSMAFSLHIHPNQDFRVSAAWELEWLFTQLREEIPEGYDWSVELDKKLGEYNAKSL